MANPQKLIVTTPSGMKALPASVILTCVLLQGCGEAESNVDAVSTLPAGVEGISVGIESEPQYHVVSVDHPDGPIYLQHEPPRDCRRLS